MKLKLILLASATVCCLSSNAQTLNDMWNTTKDAVKTATSSAATTVTNVISGTTTPVAPALTNDEVIRGLKEALSVGTNSSSTMASKVDGYLKNPKLFIPWPAEAQDMRAKLIKLGMEKKVKEFETSLNRAAEEAAKKASPVFLNAITGMSIGDGFAILNGSDSAATHYLREKTFAPLKEQFMPIIKEAIAKVKVTSY